ERAEIIVGRHPTRSGRRDPAAGHATAQIVAALRSLVFLLVNPSVIPQRFHHSRKARTHHGRPTRIWRRTLRSTPATQGGADRSRAAGPGAGGSAGAIQSRSTEGRDRSGEGRCRSRGSGRQSTRQSTRRGNGHAPELFPNGANPRRSPVTGEGGRHGWR